MCKNLYTDIKNSAHVSYHICKKLTWQTSLAANNTSLSIQSRKHSKFHSFFSLIRTDPDRVLIAILPDARAKHASMARYSS